MKRLAAALLVLAFTAAPALAQTSVSPVTPQSRPESMAVSADGTLYLGSQLDGRIYRARAGQATAEQFIDLRPSAFILGLFADNGSNTLWVCEIVSRDPASPLIKAKSNLRGFDLATGASKVNIPMPGDSNLCNDFTVGPDKALYVADTTNAKVMRLRPGATELELVVQHPALYGVDGLTFLDGNFYVNTVWAGGLYRIPLDLATGKAGTPVQILTPRVLASPDGMRAHNGVMYLAESGNGTVSAVTVKNDVATLRPIATGLNGPCAIEPHGDVVWAVERPAHRVTAIKIPK